MNITQYLIESMQNGAHRTNHWMTDVFAVIFEPSKEDYPYKLFIEDNKFYTLVPYETSYQTVQIETNGVTTEPLCDFDDQITIPGGSFEIVPKTLKTTIGLMVANIFLINDTMPTAIPYINNKFNARDVERLIGPVFVDTPKDGKSVPGKVTVKDKLAFINASQHLEKYVGVLCYSTTPKTILPAPGVSEFKAKLKKKYPNATNDPLEGSKMDDELRAFDVQYLKDDPSLGKFMSGKVLNKARLKVHGAFGAETGFEGVDARIDESLVEGLPTDSESLAQQFNQIIIGSLSRGKDTQKSGAKSKLIVRLVASITMSDKDCKTPRYTSTYLYKNNKSKYIGMYLWTPKGPTLITQELADKLTDKPIKLRLPSNCKSSNTQICRYCSGEMLYIKKRGIALGAMSVGDSLMNSWFALTHGVVIKSVRTNWKRSLGSV